MMWDKCSQIWQQFQCQNWTEIPTMSSASFHFCAPFVTPQTQINANISINPNVLHLALNFAPLACARLDAKTDWMFVDEKRHQDLQFSIKWKQCKCTHQLNWLRQLATNSNFWIWTPMQNVITMQAFFANEKSTQCLACSLTLEESTNMTGQVTNCSFTWNCSKHLSVTKVVFMQSKCQAVHDALWASSMSVNSPLAPDLVTHHHMPSTNRHAQSKVHDWQMAHLTRLWFSLHTKLQKSLLGIPLILSCHSLSQCASPNVSPCWTK